MANVQFGCLPIAQAQACEQRPTLQAKLAFREGPDQTRCVGSVGIGERFAGRAAAPGVGEPRDLTQARHYFSAVVVIGHRHRVSIPTLHLARRSRTRACGVRPELHRGQPVLPSSTPNAVSC